MIRRMIVLLKFVVSMVTTHIGLAMWRRMPMMVLLKFWFLWKRNIFISMYRKMLKLVLLNFFISMVTQYFDLSMGRRMLALLKFAVSIVTKYYGFYGNEIYWYFHVQEHTYASIIYMLWFLR